MAKEKKPTLKEMYELSLNGMKIEMCEAMSFYLPSEGDAIRLYYRIISEKGLSVGVIDRVGKRVNIVLPFRSQAQNVREIAKELNAEERRLRL